MVLDPFAGSGSTGVAARLENTQFLGFEIDAKTARKANSGVEGCVL